MSRGVFTGPLRTSGQLAGPMQGHFFHFVEGIEAAIDLILAGYGEAGRDWFAADTLVFPLGMLARHLVELRLKELYREALQEDAPREHNLLRLWSALRPEIEAVWPSANDSTQSRYGHLSEEQLAEWRIELRHEGSLDYLEDLIRAFHELDPSGTRFRYPGSFGSETRGVVLHTVGAVARQISRELDGLHTGFYEMNAARAEMESEAREVESEIRAEMEAEYRAEMAGDGEW